ncbi:MAG: hypothetical protein F6K39_12405 [Okeania sp. SIO3B3]|nr:hypothetical protein [Okeania sp. SIO3B3]
MSLVSIEILIEGTISGNLFSFTTHTIPSLVARPDKEIYFSNKGLQLK